MSKGFASNYRIVLLATAMVGCFGGLGARLVFLHVIDRDELVRSIEKARRQIIPEKARRGDILDSNEHILATSRSLIVLGVDPQVLRKEDEAKWPQLAALIGRPAAEVERILNTKTRAVNLPATAETKAQPAGMFRFVGLDDTAEPKARSNDDTDADDETQVDEADVGTGEHPIRWAKLAENLSESTYAQIETLKIKGVYGNRVYRRAYPHNSLAAHIVGFVNKAGDPAAGIERYADFYLRGRDGWREGERDGKGREIAQFRTREVAPSDGYSVELSIDSTVQHLVEEELEYIAQKYHPQKATIIVSDPRTGFILALGNYPTFDLNEYNKVPRDKQGAMRNIAVADMYEPGSCFKIVAASAALEEHLVTPATTFDCSLTKIDYRGKPRSLPGEDHHFENLSVAEIISHSSNRGAAQLAMLMGEEKFYSYARGFGFGQLSDFPVGGEVPGMMAPPSKWDGLTITRMPMGHSVAATPLQMHMAMGVIASRGQLLRPQLIRQIRDASGESVYRYATVSVRRVISEQTARTMARLLMGVASPHGTAPDAAIPNYEVAGKTGTTQKLEPVTLADGRVVNRYSNRHHVASFVGFLPASRPEIAISVFIDDADAHAQNGVAYGSSVAAPSFKRLAQQLIQYRDIKPVYSPEHRESYVMGENRR